MVIRFDPRWVVAGLLVIIGGMLIAWQPWQQTSNTITVTGQVSLKAAPDEYVFTPSYYASADSTQEAVSKVSATGNAVVAKLKELGVKDNELKTDVTGGQGYPVPLIQEGTLPDVGTGTTAYYSITATVRDAVLAQKILDYIVTTDTAYAVTPQSRLSKEARQKLESEARAKAINDARTKAQATAAGVGAKLGRVVSVADLIGGGIIFMAEDSATQSPTLRTEVTTAPTLLVGEQDLDFSIQVVYQLR